MATLASASTEDGTPVPSPLASPRLWALVGIVFLVLFAGYWFLIRTAYVPVLANVEPQDAADIVKVLDARKIAYRLADGGRTIEVASDAADMARIELVGSELPMRGQVGFELFNQSDMGLTEFAQKINYQRALQGELARTILLLDGIEAVRVHLGLPERSIFRDEQSQPKASVALVLKPGMMLTEGTVAGIQRLVAGSIPEMRIDGVSVLDGAGRVISSERAPGAALSGSDAILDNYRQQIVALISRDHPALRYDINVSLRNVAVRPEADVQAARASGPAPRGDPDFAIHVRVTTPEALDDAQRLDLISAIERAIGFDKLRGDAIVFMVGDLPPNPAATTSPILPDRVVAKASKRQPVESGDVWTRFWPIGVVAILCLLAAAWLRDRRRASARKREGLKSFAEQLRQRLHVAQGAAT